MGGGNFTLRYIALHSMVNGELWKFDAAAGKSIVFVSHVQVTDNKVNSGAFFVSEKGDVRVSDSFFDRNIAIDTGGAARGIGANVFMTWTRVRFERNAAGANGGAVSVTDGSSIRAISCAFVANSAQRGGAIFVAEGSFGIITRSIFKGNKATKGGGAGIATSLGTVDIEHSVFTGSTAPKGVKGAALHLDRPPVVKILNTSFTPFKDASTVFLAGQLGGCEKHPCNPGHQCSYADYSLTCTRCKKNLVSPGGNTSCTSCERGYESNAERTGCVACAGNTYSTAGVCNRCNGRVRDDNETRPHAVCDKCPMNQIADPPELGCRCEKGFFDASPSTELNSATCLQCADFWQNPVMPVVLANCPGKNFSVEAAKDYWFNIDAQDRTDAMHTKDRTGVTVHARIKEREFPAVKNPGAVRMLVSTSRLECIMRPITS